MHKRLFGLLLFLLLGACAGQIPVPAGEVASAEAVPPKTGVAPPPGFVEFCGRLPEECAGDPASPRQVELNVETLSTMRTVNVAMNGSIRPKEDRAHYGVEEYWTIPIDGYADCDDYVLVKRKALIALGFPQRALHIAEVFTANFVRHVVLVVQTDKGNYVLDNLKDELTTSEQTGYAWLKWQDGDSATGWAKLN